MSSFQLPLLRFVLQLQTFIYLEEFGNVTYCGDRGVDTIQNIQVDELVIRLILFHVVGSLDTLSQGE